MKRHTWAAWPRRPSRAEAVPGTAQAPPTLKRAPRLVCAAAAMATTATLATALLAGWHQQSETRWLAATPAVLADLEACEQVPDRAASSRCKQLIVEDRLHATRRSVDLAAAPGSARRLPSH